MRVVLLDEADTTIGTTVNIFNNLNRVILGMVSDYGLGLDLQNLLTAFSELQQQNADLLNRMELLEEKMDNFDGEKALVRVGRLVEVDASISDMSEFMGYGSWELFGRGRMTICSGAITERGITHTFNVSQIGGEVQHILSIAAMPEHDHDMAESSHHNWIGNRNGVQRDDIPNTTEAGRKTSKTGGGQPHNNMSPYVVIQRWKRIA